MTRWKERAELLNTLGVQFDLAVEAHDLLRGARGGEVPGVALEEDERSNATIKTVTVLNEQGAQQILQCSHHDLLSGTRPKAD